MIDSTNKCLLMCSPYSLLYASVASPLVIVLKFLGSFRLGQGLGLQVVPGSVSECLQNTKKGQKGGGLVSTLGSF